jgi:hypothetical protein
MSDEKKRGELSEEQLERLIAQAFRDEMIPTSLEEVRRAEEQSTARLDVALPELPERSASPASRYGSRDAQVVSLDTRRVGARGNSSSQWLHWGIAAMVGAAAASVALIFARPVAPPPGIQGAGDDGTVVTVPPRDEMKPLVISAPCSDCCAGSSCDTNRRECASGRTCVGCQPGPQDRFRIRLGDLSWAEQFQGKGEAQPVICIQVGQSEEECLGEIGTPPQIRTWVRTQSTYSPTQLLDSVRLQLRTQKERVLLAQWERKVSLTPDTLCKGLAVQFTETTGESVARVSAFVDDAQFVELERAASPRLLLLAQENLKDPERLSRIHETTADGERHFVLSLGPLAGNQLEKVRWQLLDQERKFEITTGGDYVGEPRQ